MSNTDFIPNVAQIELAERKTDKIINLLSDVSIEMKGYILMLLIESFKNTSGIDLYKSFKIEQYALEEKEK
jgi:hypothetical protein